MVATGIVATIKEPKEEAAQKKTITWCRVGRNLSLFLTDTLRDKHFSFFQRRGIEHGLDTTQMYVSMRY